MRLPFLILLSSIVLNLSADFKIKNYKLIGESCDEFNSSITLTTDTKTASILFDEFSDNINISNNTYIPFFEHIKKGRNNYFKSKRFIERKTCILVLDFEIAPFTNIDFIEVKSDIRGYIYKNDDTQIKLIQFMGSIEVKKGKNKLNKNLVYSKSYSSDYNDDFIISSVRDLVIFNNCFSFNYSDFSLVLQNDFRVFKKKLSHINNDLDYFVSIDSIDLITKNDNEGISDIEIIVHTKNCY